MNKKFLVSGLVLAGLMAGCAPGQVLTPVVGTTAQISTDTSYLGVVKAVTSRTGNVALNGTNQTMATYEFKAVGEDVMVNTLNVCAFIGVAGGGKTLKNMKIMINTVSSTDTAGDVQVGTTQTTVVSATQEIKAGITDPNEVMFTFGNSLIVKAGSSVYLKVVGDLTGTSVNGDAVQVALTQFNVEEHFDDPRHTGVTLLGSPLLGNPLTIAQGTLTGTTNASVSSMAVVRGANNQLAGSVIVTAGSAEAVDLNSLSITDVSGVQGLGQSLSNIKLMMGTTQLGVTQVNPATATGVVMNFNISPVVKIPASGSVQLDFRADILSGATLANNQQGIKIVSASSVGESSGSAVNLQAPFTAKLFSLGPDDCPSSGVCP